MQVIRCTECVPLPARRRRFGMGSLYPQRWGLPARHRLKLALWTVVMINHSNRIPVAHTFRFPNLRVVLRAVACASESWAMN